MKRKGREAARNTLTKVRKQPNMVQQADDKEHLEIS
jgi:hypothetical protein